MSLIKLIKSLWLLSEFKKSQYPYMLPPRGVSTAYRTRTNFVRAGNLPNVIKSLDIKLCLWRRVEVSCFSTTTADAINTARPCRAACDPAFANSIVVACIVAAASFNNLKHLIANFDITSFFVRTNRLWIFSALFTVQVYLYLISFTSLRSVHVLYIPFQLFLVLLV